MRFLKRQQAYSLLPPDTGVKLERAEGLNPRTYGELRDISGLFHAVSLKPGSIVFDVGSGTFGRIAAVNIKQN